MAGSYYQGDERTGKEWNLQISLSSIGKENSGLQMVVVPKPNKKGDVSVKDIKQVWWERLYANIWA